MLFARAANGCCPWHIGTVFPNEGHWWTSYQWHTWGGVSCMPVLFCAIIAATASLTDEERQSIEAWLFWIQSGLVVLVVALIVFAFALRRIAKNSTAPCRWCMEFVPKKASVCPRCGKAKAVEGGTPKAEG